MKELFKTYRSNSSTLHSAVYDTLKEVILNEQLTNELTENEIAKTLNVSRTPVRSAMQMLQSEGLITIFHGKKARINHIKKSDIKDIELILSGLHILSAELCIKNIESNEIDELEEIIYFIHLFTLKKDYSKLVEYNTKFHLKICEFSKNIWLYNIMDNLLNRTFIKRKNSISKHSRIVAARDEHTEIFLAIKEKNTVKVKKLIEDHVKKAYQYTSKKEDDINEV